MLDCPPRPPYPLHQATEPQPTPKVREKRLVLRKSWRVDGRELHGAFDEIDRRFRLIHQGEVGGLQESRRPI